jgi:membrane protease YdiL (CAAX protease family)
VISARRIRAFFYLLLLFVAPLAWEVGAGLSLLPFAAHLNEAGVLAVVKIGFALALLGVMAATGCWRSWGFAGGLRPDYWGLLWPLWIASLLSLAQDFVHLDAARFLIWLPIAFAVAFGEEGIFRGAILTALDGRRPRRAVLISSFMFGAIHLAALLTPLLDWRMVLAQASFAFGFGIILGAVRFLSGSIWPGIIVHGVLDYTGLVAAGSLAEALTYAPSSVIFMLLAAVIATSWGLYLCRRLPADSGG